MNFRTLSENDLSDFAANVGTLLGGDDLVSLDPNVRTDLGTALGTLPAALKAQTAAAAVAEAERKAAVSTRNQTRAQIRSLMGRVRDALKAGVAPKTQYDLCGFDYPTSRGPYVPVAPTALSAFGYSNGVNVLRFTGNNKSGVVVYEIWRLYGDTVDWGLYATTKKQSFEDNSVTPGEYYEYKVRAVAAKSASTFSNAAVVYGAVKKAGTSS
jgi:hypothetical protein